MRRLRVYVPTGNKGQKKKINMSKKYKRPMKVKP